MEPKFKEKIDELDNYFHQKEEEISEMSPNAYILGRLKTVKQQIDDLKNSDHIESKINILKEDIDKIYDECEPPKEDLYGSHFV